MLYMRNIRIDSNYNIVEIKNPYSEYGGDDIELINAILKAKESKEITEEEAHGLLEMILDGRIQKQTKRMFAFLNYGEELNVLFNKMKNKKINHARTN